MFDLQMEDMFGTLADKEQVELINKRRMAEAELSEGC